MKKIILSIFCLLTVISARTAFGQGFTVTADTVWATWTEDPFIVNDKINDTGATDVKIKWQVVATDFPIDWADSFALGICDNNVCYNNTSDTYLWNIATGMPGAIITSGTYSARTTGDPFHLQLALAAASNGTHYLTVCMKNAAGGTGCTNETFIINRNNNSVPEVVPGSGQSTLYPNPATNEVNIIYDANSNIKTIAIYNIIGKVMSVFKVSGNSANLDVEHLPSGIYFTRMINSEGGVVATRKFTKI
jgi:hypothetical protein